MSDNVQPPPKRYVVGLDDYYRKKVERNARRANGEHNMAGLPVTDEARLQHVDEMVAAFRNLEGIVDSPEDKIHIEFARDLDEEEAQMKAWEYLVRKILRTIDITHLTFYCITALFTENKSINCSNIGTV